MAEPPFMPSLPTDPDAYDYTDTGAAQQRESEAALRAKRLREVEAAILSTPQGREWLWGLLAGLHVHELRIAVTGSSFENGVWTGEYAAGNRIMRRFASASPADFAQMFVENDESAN